MNENAKEVFRSIQEQIAVHGAMDLSVEWTPEYREGVVDGLKIALDVVKEVYGLN